MVEPIKCDIGADCPNGYACDIPTHTCKPVGTAVTQIVPAPDPDTEHGWLEQLLSKGSAMLYDWRETQISYETMVAERAQFGVPLISGGWTQAREDSYWTLNTVVLTLARYLGEASEGARSVAYDLFGNQPALIGEAGEMELSYANGVLSVKTSGGSTVVDSKGFTGAPPALVAVIVIAGAAVQIAGILAISATIRAWIDKTIQQDAFDNTQKQIAAGVDPTLATKNTNEVIAALAAKKRAEAEASEKSETGQLLSVVKAALWVGLAVAVVGGAIYFTLPLMKGASTRQLAQQNPATKRPDWEVDVVDRENGRTYTYTIRRCETSEHALRLAIRKHGGNAKVGWVGNARLYHSVRNPVKRGRYGAPIDTRPECPFCGAKTWDKDFVGFMRSHDRPQGGRCLQAAKAYSKNEGK